MGTRDMRNPPNLTIQGDHVCGISNELERGRLVQAGDDHTESTITVCFHERAGVWICRCTFIGTVPKTLRQGIKTVFWTKLYINQERSTRGY